jgi:hypothetical protein
VRSNRHHQAPPAVVVAIYRSFVPSFYFSQVCFFPCPYYTIFKCFNFPENCYNAPHLSIYCPSPTSTLHADPAKSRPSHNSSLAQPHQLAGPVPPARWSSSTRNTTHRNHSCPHQPHYICCTPFRNSLSAVLPPLSIRHAIQALTL